MLISTAIRDLNALQANTKTLRPWRTYTHHAQVVNDVQYHPISPHFIGSVSDDLTLQIVDVRSSDTTKAALRATGGHLDAINALAFNPNSELLVATASADKTIGMWDLRNVKEKVHTLEGHEDAVTSLQWHPTEAGILGSGSYDRRIIFWDVTRVGEEQLPDDQEDGPPELYVLSNQSFPIEQQQSSNNLISDSLCTVDTPITLLTLVGTLTNHGSSQAPLKIIFSRSGKWQNRLLVRMTAICPSTSLTDRCGGSSWRSNGFHRMRVLTLTIRRRGRRRRRSRRRRIPGIGE